MTTQPYSLRRADPPYVSLSASLRDRHFELPLRTVPSSHGPPRARLSTLCSRYRTCVRCRISIHKVSWSIPYDEFQIIHKQVFVMYEPILIFTSPLELIAHDKPTSVSEAATPCIPTAPFDAAAEGEGPNTASAAAARVAADVQNDAVSANFHRMGEICCFAVSACTCSVSTATAVPSYLVGRRRLRISLAPDPADGLSSSISRWRMRSAFTCEQN